MTGLLPFFVPNTIVQKDKNAPTFAIITALVIKRLCTVKVT